MKPKFGDRVKIVTDKNILEGLLLQRPDILKGDFTVVKLDTGYNLGIESKKIKKIEILKEYCPPKNNIGTIKKNTKLPDVSLLSFGGTISSKVDYRTGGVYADYTADDFVRMCPELGSIANLNPKKVMGIMSEDMHAEEWKKMAKETHKELCSGAKGVILTQGTDTLHFSSAAMSFMLQDLNKPIIFTAAQRSIDRGSSDAFMNLICSTIAASNFNGAEVMSCLHGTTNDDYCILNRGTKVRKMHTSRRDAFRPINELPIAKVYENGKINILNDRYKKRSDCEPILDDKFEKKTALVQIHPNIDPDIINYYIDKGYKGIVLSATALGHIPIEGKHGFLKVLERAKQESVSVAITTQTIYGRVHPFVYTNLRKLSIQSNCIFTEDMTPETSFVKLGWVLGHTKEPSEVKKMMLTNFAGEISQRHKGDSFLY